MNLNVLAFVNHNMKSKNTANGIKLISGHFHFSTLLFSLRIRYVFHDS